MPLPPPPRPGQPQGQPPQPGQPPAPPPTAPRTDRPPQPLPANPRPLPPQPKTSDRARQQDEDARRLNAGYVRARAQQRDSNALPDVRAPAPVSGRAPA